MKSLRSFVLFVAAIAVVWPQAAAAQAARPAPPPDDPDRDINFSQPDFNLVALPTTLRLPKFKSSFRVTHRFTRALGDGDFGDLAEDLFGLDSGAQIGLEYRFGLWSGLQAGIHRTSDRTIEFFTQYNLMQQGKNGPLGMGVVASVDGTNNFKDSYTPAIGVAISRELGRHGAVYLEPMWVNNSNPLPTELVDDNDTILFGLGGRFRIRPTVYIVAEVSPRALFSPGANQGSVGIEKRAGGHLFQLNFGNGFGTTIGQLAGSVGRTSDDWYMGFNIARKFF